jgi:hypothetical protein
MHFGMHDTPDQAQLRCGPVCRLLVHIGAHDIETPKHAAYCNSRDDTDKQHCNLQQQTEQNIELTLLL